MQGILFGAIVGIASVFLALTIAIIAGKAWREIRDRRHRARRKVLEPIVLAYAHGSEASILPALGGGVAPSDRPVLEKILLDHAQRVSGIERARLAKVLDELGFVDVYRRGLHAAGWWTRAESAENLGLSGAVRVAPDLLAALEDDASEVRLRAARALGAIGADAAVAPLLRALSEPNRWSTIRIADILAGMGPRIVGELVAAYPTLNRPGRLATLDIVGRLRPLETAGWLVERTRDPEPDVRAIRAPRFAARSPIPHGRSGRWRRSRSARSETLRRSRTCARRCATANGGCARTPRTRSSRRADPASTRSSGCSTTPTCTQGIRPA